MNALRSFAANHPVIFLLVLAMTWLLLLLLFMGIAASLLQKPFNDPLPPALGRLGVLLCTLFLLWRLGWLQAAGVARWGHWQAWMLAAGGVIYFASASLYAFYGAVDMDLSTLLRLPAARSAIVTTFMAGLSEEVLFRGLALYALVRAWGQTSRGALGSVALTSALFALLHLTQVFTAGVSPLAAALLVMQTSVIAFWWGALVLWGGSVWPAVLLHVAGNAIVALQGLTLLSPLVVSASAYLRLFWLSAPLGLLGAWLLARTGPRASTIGARS